MMPITLFKSISYPSQTSKGFIQYAENTTPTSMLNETVSLNRSVTKTCKENIENISKENRIVK